MALYLQNMLRNSKNYPGVNFPGNFFFLITDNINEPIRQLIEDIINYSSGFLGKCLAGNQSRCLSHKHFYYLLSKQSFQSNS